MAKCEDSNNRAIKNTPFGVGVFFYLLTKKNKIIF
jgi:hypothetical protein